MDVVDFNRCECACHKTHAIKHIMPCCRTCQYCGQKRIKHLSIHKCSEKENTQKERAIERKTK